ncbi:major facilitator superfamily protein [Trichomonas vaginalis G3]|uniref:Major facilitator superfamily protein n=1 Tax=Trichomonas vaginalis (strain ATCC PRA-98 / G3) TaxID=412133 RepID=A2F9D2_TRIV3|nr:major facilitator superfamily transporter [Trichomonas vaginalis G3]EAX98504.1 major facilitator superfamily protein [Trichomonas vaginalis G3]KAI5506741.1 glucose import [Trichomonas vaginalis G3]|eukprot:XP_001311434.1 major facilitator superfamily transporter [Trichomonas vaginalis G3]
MGVFSVELLYALPIILTPFTFGFIIGYTSPALPYYEDKWNISSIQSTFFNAITALFACVGPYLTTFLLKFFGRRVVIVIIDIINIISWACLFALSKKIFWFGIIIRALQGIILGACTAIGPLYLVEITPPSYVEFYGTLNQLCIVIGIVILYIIGQYYHPWVLHILAIVTSVIQITFIWFVPETSPLYDKTASSTEKESSDEDKGDIKESIFDKAYIKKVFIMIAVMASQQLSGANAMITNLSSLFESAHVPHPSGLAAAITMFAQALACIAAAAITGKIKRRIMWLMSTITCFISLFVYALNQKFNWSSTLSIVLQFLYQFGFGIALSPMPWYSSPEMFPPALRPMASSINSMTSWLCAFIIIFVYPQMKDHIGDFGAFLIFSADALFAIIFGSIVINEPSKDDENLDDNNDNIDNKSR